MAIYREAHSTWRRFLPFVIGALIIIGTMVIIVILSHAASTTNSAADPVDTALDTINQAFDLFGIEYFKVANGTPAAQTGAPGAIARAQAAYNAVATSLSTLDATAAAALGKDLDALTAALAVPNTTVDNLLADASAQVLSLRKARPATH